MPLLNVFLNHAMITVLCIIVILAIRDSRHTIAGKILIALSISVCCLSAINMPPIQSNKNVFYYVMHLLSIPNIGLAWWFLLSLLKDDFKLSTFEWIGMSVMCIIPSIYLIELLGFVVPFWQEINIFGIIVPFIMIAHILWVTWSEKDNDLIDSRRQARLWLAAALIVTFVVSLLSEYVVDPVFESLLRLSFSLPACVLLLLWLTKLQPEILKFEKSTSPKTMTSGIDPKDAALNQRLLDAMEKDCLFKKHGLTINTLAVMLKTQEHRLRMMINQGLGHRNFSTFLSGYRLAYVKAQLADQEKARLPIISIALDAGFSSLQTFNRVFKNSENCTPSAYRQRMLTK